MKQKSSFFHPRLSPVPPVAAAAIGVVLLSSAAHAAEATYKYFRFTPTAVSDGATATAIQLSEFNFSYKGQKLNLNGNLPVGTPVQVTVTDGSGRTEGEFPGNLIDDKVSTKWYSGTLAPLVFEFETPVTIDTYNFATANDFSGRNPTAWTLQGSSDGTTYTTLDTRTGYGAISVASYFTYQLGFALPNPAAAPVITAISATTPAIVLPGGSVNLAYTVTLPTGASAISSVMLNPGNINLGTGTTGTFTVNPSETTTYTLTVTNAAGSVSREVEINVAQPRVLQSRYVRFTPLAFRNASTASTQLAEFEFFLGDTKIPVASVQNKGGRTPTAEGPANIIDGSPTTKWLDFNRRGMIFDFGVSLQFDSYQITAANDDAGRDPVQWLLESSEDGVTWTILDHVGQSPYPFPYARSTANPAVVSTTGKIPFREYPAPLVWSGSGPVAAWDVSSPNFAGGQVFTPSRSVRFDDTAAANVVRVPESLVPGTITFANQTKDYTLEGEGSLNGPANLVKSGAGTLSLNSKNYLNGLVHVTGGKLVANVAGAFGRTDNNNRVILENAELQVSPPVLLDNEGQPIVSTVFTDRPLFVSNSTLTIPENVQFTHVGKFGLDKTVTKTGPGVLRFYGYQDSSATNDDNHLIVEQGTVEFGSSYYNNYAVANRYFITVKGGATLRGTNTYAFGGNYADGFATIGQFRVEEEGTLDLSGSRHYIPIGRVTKDGVPQGRIVLKGAKIVGGSQIENNRVDATANGTHDTRSVISTEPSAITSEIASGGSLTTNRSHFVFDVADGEAAEDLTIWRTIDGAYGFIKEGAGNLVLFTNNTYQGRKNTYVQSIDNPNNTTGFDESTASVKVFDMPHGTTVNAGTLTILNLRSAPTDSATGASPVLIGPAGTLSGSGFITGTVDLQGALDPGDPGFGEPIHEITLGSTTLSGTYKWEVNGVNPASGNGVDGSDLLIVEGDLSITGGSLQVAPIGAGFTEESYVVATYTGTRTGTFASVTPGYQVIYNDAAKQIEVKVSDGTEPTGYAAWIAGTDLTGDDAGAGADPDNDGIANLIEFVLDSDPESSDAANAPTIARDDSGNLVFTFRRSSAAAYLNPSVEYSTSLAPGEWTAAPGGSVSVEANGFGTGVDKVTVTLPASLAGGGKLFARLTATL